MKDVFSFLYGYIFTIVESWLFRILVFMVESVHWILYRKISIALIWDKLNVIQQIKLVSMMRPRFKARKEIIRIDTI